MAHAHARQITHRAMSARSVLVCPSGPGDLPQLVIGHWQTGARDLATSLTCHDTTATGLGGDLAERLAAGEEVRLAPETISVASPQPHLAGRDSRCLNTERGGSGRTQAPDVAFPVRAAVEALRPDRWPARRVGGQRRRNGRGRAPEEGCRAREGRGQVRLGAAPQRAVAGGGRWRPRRHPHKPPTTPHPTR